MLSAVLGLPGIFEILAHLRERSNRGKRRRALREGWGRPVARRRDFGQYPACLSYRALAGQPNYIDGQTWSDLNLEAVFASMDRTITSPGEIELYRILRLPEHDEARLVERDRMIISSISVSDDLLAGKSLFMAEAERLLEVIVRARSAHSLGLLEEILRGTNAAERIAAAKAIVRYLAECDSVTMVATHDLQVLDGVPLVLRCRPHRRSRRPGGPSLRRPAHPGRAEIHKCDSDP